MIIISFLLLVYSMSFSAQPLMTSQKIEIIKKGEEALLNGQWLKADSIYNTLCLNDSTDPVGYLYRAVVLQTEMVDKEENLHREKMIALLDNTKFLVERKLRHCSSRDSALCYLYLGHCYAYRSIWEVRFGSGFSAISNGFKAKGEYHKGLRADSTLYDLYLGLGSYHYWKTVKSGFLKWVRIFKDDREKGIAEINLAIDSSLFSKEASYSALLWIFINEREYDSAVILAEKMRQRYPGGNSFLWPLAESLYKLEKHSRAAEVYDTLLGRLKTEPGNYYNLIETIYLVYDCYDKLDNRQSANEVLVYLNSIYNEIPKKTRRKQKNKLSYLKRKYQAD